MGYFDNWVICIQTNHGDIERKSLIGKTFSFYFLQDCVIFVSFETINQFN